MKPHNNLLRSQAAALRAHSLLAYHNGMWLRHNLKVSLHRNKPLCGVLSRRSLRGALHLGLLATVLVRFP
jgi:hypothetical protein